MSPNTTRWRSSSTYDYVDHLTAPDVGWEWLRRNEDYQYDFDRLQRARLQTPDLIEQASAKWGLRFRHRAKPQRH
ncbi:transcriptional regulator domain-containing protein [Pelagibacterium halotolerans]|uniref:transcriptional regulator domain-containing protein n=1 Tax=Pelagibacterium halotolerans TaxID=531813 RepID=UPI00384AB5B7